MTATITVPTLPPAMWALIAKPAPLAAGTARPAGRCRPGAAASRRSATAMFGIANVGEAGRQRLGREPATEQDAAEPEQPPPRDAPGQLRVG